MTQRPRRRDRTAQAQLSPSLVTSVASGGPAILSRPVAPQLGGHRRTPGLDRNGSLATAAVRPGAKAGPLGFALTVESALYVILIAAAALTRFWDLGKRAIHHDESLHAYYSWVLSQGNGFRHDPLMHGPFLFEANALV